MFPERRPASLIPGAARVEWAAGTDIAVPEDFLKSGFTQNASAIENLRDLRAYTNARPASSRLPISYQFAPDWLRSLYAGAVGKSKAAKSGQWARYPFWPLDLSVDFWTDYFDLPAVRYQQTPVVLSHDLDSREGVSSFLKNFAPLEERAGARSVCFFVPNSWKLPHGELKEIQTRGHELGIHGYDHSNKTPFLSLETQKRRIEAARQLVNQYGISGYRAPSLLRTRSLIERLSEVYAYDSSIPTSGGLFPVPNNGCATARPYMITEKMWEFPLTLPRDGSLRFFGLSPDKILSLWIECSERISASGGLINVLTHCENRFSGNPAMLAVYSEFLNYLSTNRKYQFTTFSELLTKLRTGENCAAKRPSKSAKAMCDLDDRPLGRG